MGLTAPLPGTSTAGLLLGGKGGRDGLAAVLPVSLSASPSGGRGGSSTHITGGLGQFGDAIVLQPRGLNEWKGLRNRGFLLFLNIQS